ncbi:hypothetical protein ACOM2C_14160 [Pseudarthrobacter sp. So.54]
MKMVILAISAWVLTGVIVLLGVSVGSTIWFYMEPVVDTVPDPASYYVAAAAGFLALFLSFGVSVGVTIHAVGCNAAEKPDPSDYITAYRSDGENL